MFKSVIKFVVNRPWVVIFAWLAIVASVLGVALGGVLGQNLFERMQNSSPTVAGEAQTGADLISSNKQATSSGENIFILVKGVDSNSDNTEIKKFFEDSRTYSNDKGYQFISPFGITKDVLDSQTDIKKLISDNSFISIISVTDEVGQLEDNVIKTEQAINSYAEKVNLSSNQQIIVGGETSLVDSIVHQAETDLSKGELIALPVALLVLVLVFGGLLAAGMPLLGAIVSIVSALGTLHAVSYFIGVDTSTLNVLTVIGLGLSIDYGLLMISRFRETLRLTPNSNTREGVKSAVEATIASAGRTVMASGITVAVATMSLLLFEPELMKVIGIAATSVVLLAIVSSATLLPAIFVLLGDRLIKPSFIQRIPLLGKLMKLLGDVSPEEGAFSKLARKVQKHRWLTASASLLVLVIMSVPLMGINVSNMGVDKLPVGTPQGTLFTDIKNDYPNLQAPDVKVVMDKSKGLTEADVNEYQQVVQKLPVDLETVTYKDYENIFVISMYSDEPIKVVKELRDYKDNAKGIYITGETAQDIDYVKSISETAPLVALIIVIVTALLLFLMTGSVLIPIKAVVLSVLSLSASVGVLTWGFQDGGLSQILNFDPSRIVGIDPLILVLVLVFGFGLAMDYEMFLISRIKEKHAHGETTDYAVSSGVQASGRIITTAALMIIIVFIGFAMGDMLMIKMMGVALATAVLIDATIVRVLLVPAIFAMLGDKIWWSPKWLTKIHDKVGFEH